MEEETLSRFVCFACGAWGSMETARAQWRQVALQKPPAYRQRVPHRRQPPPRLPRQPVAAARKRSASSLNTACACSSTSRPGSAACCLPGRSARQPRRSVPAAARHFPGPGAAARCGLCGAGHAGRMPPAIGAAAVWSFRIRRRMGAWSISTGVRWGLQSRVPKAKRHDHLPGAKGYFNAAALQTGTGPLWVCEGAFDALALLAAGVPRVVAIFGVQGWRWDWVRDVRELVFALDADTAGQQQWQALARQAALRGLGSIAPMLRRVERS